MYSIAAIILSLAWTASGSMKMDVCSRYSSQWSQMVRTGQPANAQFPLGTAINKDGNTVMTTQVLYSCYFMHIENNFSGLKIVLVDSMRCCLSFHR